MKNFLIFSLISLIGMGHAQSSTNFTDTSNQIKETEKLHRTKGVCASLVTRYNEMLYRLEEGLLKVHNLNSGEEVTSLTLDLSSHSMREKVRDLAASKDFLLILKGETIDLYERESLTFLKTLKTHKRGELRTGTFLGGSPSFAQGMTIYKEKVYIAHGNLGLKVIDIKTGHFISSHKIEQKHGKHHISSASDVTQKDGKIIFSVNEQTMISRTPLNRLPLSKRAFFGFIVMDGQTNKVLKYQYANDPRVKSIDVVSDKLIVNYFLPVWSYKTDQLLRGRKPFIKPSKVYYKLEGNLKGRPYFDSSNMYACFSNNQVTRPVILKIKDNL